MSDLYDSLGWDSQIISEKVDFNEPSRHNINDQLETLILKKQVEKLQKQLDEANSKPQSGRSVDNEENSGSKNINRVNKPIREEFTVQGGCNCRNRINQMNQKNKMNYNELEPKLYGVCVKKLIILIFVVFIVVCYLQNRAHKNEMKDMMLQLTNQKSVQLPPPVQSLAPVQLAPSS